jgi:tetratricopeptide (TPR) repeat protein
LTNGADDESACSLGWAVKELCYAAWSSDPPKAAQAAAALRRLHEAAAAAGLSRALPELDALAAWTEGIAHIVRGEMQHALTRLDAAGAAFQRLGQPRHAAQTQVPKIMALAMLGQQDAAAECAVAAQHALLTHGDARSAAKVALNLGNLHLRAGRHAAAAEHLREAATWFVRLGDAEHSVMADNGLADALTAFGSFDEAMQIYARARSRASAHGFPVLEALVDESVALLRLARGRFREALAGLEGACRRYAELEMPQREAIAEKQLADAYLELRLLPEALAGYDTALHRFAVLDMQVDRASALVQRGRALALAGRRHAAVESLDAAAEAFEALGMLAGQAAVALAHAELALVAGAGQRALGAAREAAARFRAAGLPERQLRAETVRAQALLLLGEIDSAHTLFEATLAAARELQLLPIELRCLTGRAMTASARGQTGAAREDLEAAVRLFEDQRRTLPGDEVRSAFQNDHLQPFEQLLGLALAAHEAQPGSSAAAQDVLVQLDRFRARTLADRLHDATDALDGDLVGPGVRPDLRARIAWLYRRLRRLDDESAAPATLTHELRAAERELLEHTRRQRLAGRPAGDTAASAADAQRAPAVLDPVLDIAALRQALAADDALVEYGVTGGELLACVATRGGGVHVVRRLAAWPQVAEAVRALRFQLDTLRNGRAPVQRHLPTLELRTLAHLRRLHALLWQPLTHLLGACRRVLVVPHAQLGSVPFAALHDGDQSLAEQMQMACSPGARIALHTLSRKPPAPSSLVAFGESARLPRAAHEATMVAGLLPHGRAFVGEAATLANLHAHGGGADVVHLACHAQFRGDSPVFSALHLHDGPLTAEAAQSLPLRGALVVLSACETALHDSGAGDEMFGLTRAFLAAGASRVVASLWPVEDAQTAEFMSDFYAGLRRGQAPAAALRLAQLAARSRQTHPFYWAAFVLVGGW